MVIVFILCLRGRLDRFGFQYPPDCEAGACEPAHHRAQRNLQDVRRRLVGLALDTYQQQDRPLFLRQRRYRSLHACQGEPAIELAIGIADGQRLEVRRFHRGFRSGLARPPLIDPKILHDPIHPAVEPGARLELVESPQRPLARALHKVIAIVERPREAVGEASQARQQADKFGSQFLGHPDLPLPIL